MKNNKCDNCKKQSKLSSFLESLSNEVVGYILNTTVQLLIFPLFGLNLSLSLNLFISGIHSFFGLSRIYILRRLFNLSGKKQSKKSSLLESVTNIVAGTIISFFVQLYVYPIFGVVMSMGSNFGITIIFLVITLIRLYVLRRMFNKRTKAIHKAKKAAKKEQKRLLKLQTIEEENAISI